MRSGRQGAGVRWTGRGESWLRPPLAKNEVQEEGRAEKGRQNADRKRASGDGKACQHVGTDEQRGAGNGARQDRKSTRLNSSTNAHLVCRLLLEQKKQNKK